MRRYGVIGGGIAGLVAARRLSLAAPTSSVMVLEAGDRLGGKIRTTPWRGGWIEDGADSFLTGGGPLSALVEDLGLAARSVPPAIFEGRVWTGERLVPLPRGAFLGIPLTAKAALSSPALGRGAALRVLTERLRLRRLSGPDVAVGPFVRSRFGSKVFELSVDPILAGTRAGDPNRMSLAAALALVDEAARANRSVTRGLLRQRSSAGSSATPFLSVDAGLTRLVEALAADLQERGIEIVSGASVEEIHGGRRGVRLVAAAGHDHLGTHGTAFDGVVLAAPAHVAARLVQTLQPTAGAHLARVAYASVASVAFAYDEDVTSALPGSGLLVPSTRTETISAATWFTKKWPSSAPSSGSFIRCFVGRGLSGEEPASLDDDTLTARCEADLRRIAGLTRAPSEARIVRWTNGLPRYELGHRELVRDAESALASSPVTLAGAGYRGSGLKDVVAGAEAAADRLITRVEAES